MLGLYDLSETRVSDYTDMPTIQRHGYNNMTDKLYEKVKIHMRVDDRLYEVPKDWYYFLDGRVIVESRKVKLRRPLEWDETVVTCGKYIAARSPGGSVVDELQLRC